MNYISQMCKDGFEDTLLICLVKFLYLYICRCMCAKRELLQSMGCWLRTTWRKGRFYSPSPDQLFSTQEQPRFQRCWRKVIVTTNCIYRDMFPRMNYTCVKSPLSLYPPQEKSSVESSSGWVPLLLALLYEYTSSQSHWKLYLSLWLDFETLDHPMFW